MSKTITYYLHVKDVLKGTAFALNYATKKELESAYNRYSKDTDYKVLSMHSMEVSTNVILPNELTEAFKE